VPIFGGMLIAVMTMFVVPVLYSLWREHGQQTDPETAD
jgi:copper/silver efflux system protein